MSIERTIAEAIAKNPDLAGVSFPDLYGSTALALRAFWDNLAPSLDHNTATLNDLGVCESCEEINVVSAYGELWLCPRCVADESKCAKSPGVEREATPGVEPEDATCVHCEPKAEELVTATVDPSLVVWRNHGFGRVVAASAEEARDMACRAFGERPQDFDSGAWEREADDLVIFGRTCAEWARHGRRILSGES